MIVRWPGKSKRVGQRRRSGPSGMSSPPSPEIAGVPAPSGIDGISQVPAILGKGEQVPHEYLYWEFHEGGFKQAVRTGDWKAVRLGPGKPLELYDLKTDIGETQDVAGQHPEVVARIEGYLRSARTDSPDFPFRPAKRRVSRHGVKTWPSCGSARLARWEVGLDRVKSPPGCPGLSSPHPRRARSEFVPPSRRDGPGVLLAPPGTRAWSGTVGPSIRSARGPAARRRPLHRLPLFPYIATP